VSECHGEWCHWYVRHWPSKILIGFSKFFAAVKVNQLIISRRVIGGFVSWHAVESLRTGTKKIATVRRTGKNYCNIRIYTYEFTRHAAWKVSGESYGRRRKSLTPAGSDTTGR